MNRNIILISLLLLQLSCNTTEKKNASTNAFIKDSSQKATENVVETFDGFYKKFYSDSTFQISRIQFPLNGNDTDFENLENGKMKDFENDTIFIKNNKFFWKKKGWTFLKTLKKQGDFGYNKKIENKGNIMQEEIYLEGSGDMDIRKFKQINGKWMMIYYASLMY
jgi:hypothetical protein